MKVLILFKNWVCGTKNFLKMYVICIISRCLPSIKIPGISWFLETNLIVLIKFWISQKKIIFSQRKQKLLHYFLILIFLLILKKLKEKNCLHFWMPIYKHFAPYHSPYLHLWRQQTSPDKVLMFHWCFPVNTLYVLDGSFWSLCSWFFWKFYFSDVLHFDVEFFVCTLIGGKKN